MSWASVVMSWFWKRRSDMVTLPLYTRVFAWLGVGALVSAIVATAMIPWLNRLMHSGGGNGAMHLAHRSAST